MRAPRRILTLALLAAPIANPQVHKFELWGLPEMKGHKTALYWGWSNGYFPAKAASGVPLYNCLQGMTTTQVLAMIDKYYNDNPERWSAPLSDGIVAALTVMDGPCARLAPTPN
jgi:hypothetical protein